MNVSLKRDAGPVALVLVGGVLLVVGAFGRVPIGAGAQELELFMRWALMLLGLGSLGWGGLMMWRERSGRTRATVALQPEDVHTITEAICDHLHAEMNAAAQPMLHTTGVFEERGAHFHAEKEHLAGQFVGPLLERCKRFAEEGRNVYLLIDSGTTLYPLFERLGRATQAAHRNQEEWLKRFHIETNNIPGVIMLMNTGCIDEGDRYSPLAANCDLLPGVPLPVYSALTGPKTIAALEQLKKEAGPQAVFLTVITGNWIRVRRTPPTCAVPLARGQGHVEFKQALVDYSDEVYVLTPLGKVFVDKSREQVNEALKFSTKQKAIDRQPYDEVNISSERSPHVKMVTTSRPSGYVLSTHSNAVQFVLQAEVAQSRAPLQRFCSAPIQELQDLMFPFTDLPIAWSLQLETEFPHPHTRTQYFQREFFQVPAPPAPPPAGLPEPKPKKAR